MIKPLILTTAMVIAFAPFNFKGVDNTMTIEEMAEHCELSVDDFELFAGVVEAESNRHAPSEDDMTPYTTDGRIYIALTIWNRTYSESFPDDPRSVLCQNGQFSTVRRGVSCTQPTEYSRYAVIYAYDWINDGEEEYPEVLFFNCRYWFNWRPAYGDSDIDGNFFSL